MKLLVLICTFIVIADNFKLHNIRIQRPLETIFDLVVSFEIKTLEEKIRNEIYISKNDPIVFYFYWNKERGFSTEVNGLPRNLFKLRKRLETQVNPLWDLFNPPLRSSNLLQNVKISFNSRGLLESILGEQRNQEKFYYKKVNDNKYALERRVLEWFYFKDQIQKNWEITHEEIEGVFLPKIIEEITLVNGKIGEKVEVVFKQYWVNTNKAKDYFNLTRGKGHGKRPRETIEGRGKGQGSHIRSR